MDQADTAESPGAQLGCIQVPVQQQLQPRAPCTSPCSQRWLHRSPREVCRNVAGPGPAPQPPQLCQGPRFIVDRAGMKARNRKADRAWRTQGPKTLGTGMEGTDRGRWQVWRPRAGCDQWVGGLGAAKSKSGDLCQACPDSCSVCILSGMSPSGLVRSRGTSATSKGLGHIRVLAAGK